jgi:hypothetical protein
MAGLSPFRHSSRGSFAQDQAEIGMQGAATKNPTKSNRIARNMCKKGKRCEMQNSCVSQRHMLPTLTDIGAKAI